LVSAELIFSINQIEINHLGVIFIKICSIDQATVKSGYAIFQDSKLSDYGLIDLHKNKNKELRFDEMCFKLGELIQREKPDKVIFEGVNLQCAVSTLILLAQLQGVIIGVCQANHICYVILKPATWRKALQFTQGRNVKRVELKQQAKNYVKQHFNKDVSEDEADAICIGQSFLTKLI
jgi:Holliday junction resolvasome RuvABC endonuclease subunit